MAMDLAEGVLIMYSQVNLSGIIRVGVTLFFLFLFVENGICGDTGWWQPKATAHLSWQWQLNTGDVDTSFAVDVYDIDLFDAPESLIHELHTSSRRVICYFSAGTWEEWRDDAERFPALVKGNELDDWPGERWLDIRRLDVIGPVMKARLDLAVSKGCDGVEPDNVDAYVNNSGFSISYEDQLYYNRWIAQEAHRRGLSVGLKNDIEQVGDLVGDFDWAINEQCFQYMECDVYEAFVQRDKAVFGVEYKGDPVVFCPAANAAGYSWLKKHVELDEWRIGCEEYLPDLPGDEDGDHDNDGMDLYLFIQGGRVAGIADYAPTYGKSAYDLFSN